MSSARRTGMSILLLVVAIALGAAREWLFVNLNYHLDFLEHERTATYAHSRFRAWAEGADATDLRMLKWGLALLFIGTTLLLTVLMARVRFNSFRYMPALLVTFIGIGTLALALHFGASTVPAFEAVSIKLLHALQYPVPLLLIWALSWRSPS